MKFLDFDWLRAVHFQSSSTVSKKGNTVICTKLLFLGTELPFSQNCITFSCILLIANSMLSFAICKKHALVFSDYQNCQSPKDSLMGVFYKLHSKPCYYLHTILEESPRIYYINDLFLAWKIAWMNFLWPKFKKVQLAAHFFFFSPLRKYHIATFQLVIRDFHLFFLLFVLFPALLKTENYRPSHWPTFPWKTLICRF